MVKKKRKTWWIVGAVGAAVALFVGVAFYLDYNSHDSTVERGLAQIADDYGYEIYDLPGMNDHVENMLRVRIYLRDPISLDEAVKISERLRKVCTDGTHARLPIDVFSPNSSDSGMPIGEAHGFSSQESDVVRIRSLVFYPNAPMRPGEESYSMLYLTLNPQPSLWERIKGMWPW